MRKLATVRKISNLLDIPDADLIKTAIIDGWTVVVKKDEFQVNDLCVYFEIDSFLPDGDPRWQHLVDKSSRTFEGVKGHRLKTVRLRKQLSQGFAVPLASFIDDFIDSEYDEGQEIGEFFFVGADLTDFLDIKKWEAPIPAELSGQVKGNFPGFIPKTDQERCQNYREEIFVDNEDSRYEITMKLDGTSFTAYYNAVEEVHGTEPVVGGQMAWAELVAHDGVCGRNWELKTDDPANENNSLIRMYVDSGLQNILRLYGKNIAVQGELMGPGIQKNRENLTKHKLFIFDIYDIDNKRYFAPHERHAILQELWDLGLDKTFVDHVPVIAMAESLEDLGIFSIEALLQFAEGPSIIHLIREGLVFKRIDGEFSFKAISNKFLLKEED